MSELAPSRARVIAGAVLAPLAFVGLLLAPLSLEPRAHRLIAIFAAVLIGWLSEAVPVAVTALMIGPLLVACGVTDAPTAFRHYADPLLFLFVGGFMLASSMQRHGLDRRFARAVVTLPWVRGVPWRTQAALAIAATVLSMWISNTAACAIFVPILLGIPALERRPGERDPATAGLLAIAYVCSTGGLGTLVGTPPNAITVRLLEQAGVRIGFLEWLAIGLPSAALLSFVAAFITLTGAPRPKLDPSSRLAAARPWSRGEIVTAVGFGIAIAGWTLPPLCELLGVPFARELAARAHPGAVAILACLPLFVMPDPDRKSAEESFVPVLPWETAVRIDWGVILLFGGGIALGSQLEETGLASTMGRAMVQVVGATDVWTLCAIASLATIVLSEVASNTAAANILVPLAIALARELHISPIPPALAVGVAASVGFMLPIATGPNALVYATGRVPQVAMMRAGVLLDVACWILVMLLLRIICPLMGWV